MKTLRHWTLQHHDQNGLTLLVEGQHLMKIVVLEHNLIRVQLLRDGQWQMDKSWSVAPAGDVPWQGRHREDRSGFACPGCRVDLNNGLVLETDQLRLSVLEPLALRWECRTDPAQPWQPLAEDRTTGAYQIARNGRQVAHFMHRFPEERYFGLGEKTGPLERNGRRFEMRNLDAMGYDARSTDPLYKHIPFTISERPDSGALALFYDNLSTSWLDLGNELDNYHAPYRLWRAEAGDLDLYVSWAPNLRGVIKQHAALTGGTAFLPRWSLGYSASSMAYTDAKNAQDQMLGFLGQLREHDIPCDSFQMSSGYTSIGNRRYVFNWNTDKFPRFQTVADEFNAEGIHLIANIKPVLLDDHPQYGAAARDGLFVRDADTDAPETSQFWDGQGSHLDFTNPATIRWWQSNVTDALLQRGIGSTWNDNNEYEIWDSAARCNGFGEERGIEQIRPLMSQLMTRASDEAQRAFDPNTRPYLISRCAAPGTQRYAQTWTGDNRTSWETLKWNIPMGLGLSMSGFFNIGHDVGGFAGAKPDPELFLRWVQNGIFHPRFTIHSWNDDGTVNEPWMHPEVTDLVRDAIRLRYRLLPYLYTQLYRAVAEHEPILRPLFLDFPNDPACRDRQFDFMLGPDLLVASVFEPGTTHRDVVLPEWPGGWWHLETNTWHPGGTRLELPVTLSSIPVFVKGGAVLPLSEDTSRATPELEGRRVLMAFPAAQHGASYTSWMYDDDGKSTAATDGQFCLTRIELSGGAQEATLSWSMSGNRPPHFDHVEIRTPLGQALTVQGQRHESGGLHRFQMLK
ncbi:glycoside hydrolase family 31 protein [Ruegeria arenilitoris]|uniref:glycoside hydrolase family 31 protein n=1 Tax=Ruegeria arenilitoris TaxID=1173585 RepID=UPI00148092C8|nr:TIM-barrel domain-containing protein [Ruegeria arenilitoris]